MGGMTAGEVSDKRVFYNDSIQLGTPGTHKINKGVIEWPFEFDLNPAMPESVEGMANSWLVYNLHASVERPGWNQKDLISSMHIRIIRTLGPEQMESTRSRVREIADARTLKLQTFRVMPFSKHSELTSIHRRTQTFGRTRSVTASPYLPMLSSLEHQLWPMLSFHPSEKVSPLERLTCD